MLAEKEQGFRKMLEKSIVENIKIEHKVILKGQYQKAYDLLKDSLDTGITPCLVGPPGVGKSLLARKVAEDTGRSFHEVFFDENVTPSRLIGSFDPALVVRNGRNISSFEPGPLIRAMVEGGLFVAQELNRATEFAQNSLIAPLEERHYHLFPIGMVKAHENFAFVSTQNPIETAGTYRLSKVLVDRMGSWIRLDYPDKETEMEIIKENTPAFSLPESALNKIYDIVNETRNTASLEIPASPRSGIFLTKLVNKYIERFEGEDAAIKFFAPAVLSKEMRVRDEGKTINMVIEEIVAKRLG
ncbi:MoxR family ATPase [Candidatus Bathyarchaeota archaeon]|jgi:MoxR-like ATPase|nr:MoxR family ATPase [Candidatus Bathyarchaeota archaeon]MBT4320724.1 MoxR family ATPase [Candidatus Bathyarchaeota archaeon]MBT4424285.1 MoxR family ATPase [Candidatus Bathyarchaeota archaeon]MBT5642554.1 MoxR family ATPase [Candidatus Bathyarchaeota archaeon]MBT6604244.1 MoxR family ATPase [Candidatus Bathyarchaeota archaeon]